MLEIVPLQLAGPEVLHLDHGGGFDVEQNVEGVGPCRR
jgi:hypothetical protein